eukprot:g3750.t1
MNRWKPREFELDERAATLVFSDPGGGDKGGGRVMDVTPMPPEEKHTVGFRFDVVVMQSAKTGTNRHTLLCSAETEDEKRRWLEKLGGVMRTATASDADAITSGDDTGSAALGARAVGKDAPQKLKQRVGPALEDTRAAAEFVVSADSECDGPVSAAVSAVAAVVTAAVPALQPAVDLAAGVLRVVRARKLVEPAVQRLEVVVESVQRCLSRHEYAVRFEAKAGTGRGKDSMAAMLEGALQRAAAALDRLDEQQQRRGPMARMAKLVRADGDLALLKKLEHEVHHLTGFLTFAMAADSPTRAQLEQCIARAQGQIEDGVQRIEEGQQRAAAGQQRFASQLAVLTGKKMARETKEQALEQNRINPGDVVRTGHKLGSGAYGTVTKVLYVGDEAAMKTIDLHGKCVKDRDKLLAEFMGELRLMCVLRGHPRVIKVYGAFEEGDELNLVMEYAQNGDVRQMLDRYDAEDVAFDEEYWELATRLAEQAVAGVRYVLGQGILHRDLKCLNLLLDRDHKVKVSDFGLAKATEAARFGASSRTEGAGPKGSAPWMAPEHLLREPESPPYNEACDVYSFAMVMFELMTRKQPWQELAGPQISAQVISHQRPALPDVVPPELRRLIERCWAHDPTQRPTFNEVAQLLAASQFGSRAGAKTSAACATASAAGGAPELLLHATLRRLVGNAQQERHWQERHCELSSLGVLHVFKQERREALVDFTQAWVWVVAEPTAMELANAAQLQEREQIAPRKFTGSSRRRISLASDTLEHCFVLRGAPGGDIALAAPTTAVKADWVEELRRQATRFAERIVKSGVGCCPWYHVSDNDEGKSSLVEYDAASQMLRLLSAKDKPGGAPLNFVTIFGKAREGKSTLMNLLAGEDVHDGLFEISHADESCTRGVNLSSKFVASDAFCQGADAGAQVGFVDVEGQGVESTEYDMLLVTPALLLSKVLLLNWKGSAQPDAILSLLGVLADAAESINLPDDEDDNDAREEDIFGHLHIVFRDWGFASDTIAQSLLDNEKGTKKVIHKHNKIRKTLRRVFTSVRIWTFPYPTEHPDDVYKAGWLPSEPFRQRLEQLRAVIGQQLAKGPTTLGGKSLTCEDLADLMPAVLAAMNDDSMLTPHGLFEEVAARKADRAIAEYKVALHALQDEFSTRPAPEEEAALRSDFDEREAALRAVAAPLVVSMAALDELRDDAWSRVRGANKERFYEQELEKGKQELEKGKQELEKGKQELEKEKQKTRELEKHAKRRSLMMHDAMEKLEKNRQLVQKLQKDLDRKLAEVQRSDDDGGGATISRLNAQTEELRKKLEVAKAATVVAEQEAKREKEQRRRARDEFQRELEREREWRLKREKELELVQQKAEAATKAVQAAGEARIKQLEEQLDRKLAEVQRSDDNNGGANVGRLNTEAEKLRKDLERAKAAIVVAEADAKLEKEQARHARDELDRAAAAAAARKAADEAEAGVREAELKAARKAREEAEAAAVATQASSEATLREARAAAARAGIFRAAERKAAAEARRTAEAQQAELEAKLAEQAAEAGGTVQRKDEELSALRVRLEAAERKAAEHAKAEEDAARHEAVARAEESARLAEAEAAGERTAEEAEARRAAAAMAEEAAAARAAQGAEERKAEEIRRKKEATEAERTRREAAERDIERQRKKLEEQVAKLRLLDRGDEANVFEAEGRAWAPDPEATLEDREAKAEAARAFDREDAEVARQAKWDAVVAQDYRASRAVRVFCRIRPLNKKEPAASTIVKLDATTVKVGEYEHEFEFSQCFGPGSTQAEVFQATAAPCINHVISGFNATLFVYGYTGSGKTHTMEGPPSFPVPPEEEGIVPRFVRCLFDVIACAPEHTEFRVRVSYCEIYLEQIRDLLDDSGSKMNLQIRQHPEDGIYVAGITEAYVASQEDLLDLISDGAKNRQAEKTWMNEGSSRSHSVLSIVVQHQRNSTETRGDTGTLLQGKMALVDLAGSECVGRTGVTGLRMQQAKAINLSLTTLGVVINALTSHSAMHIPYRDSKLTRMLQESLAKHLPLRVGLEFGIKKGTVHHRTCELEEISERDEQRIFKCVAKHSGSLPDIWIDMAEPEIRRHLEEEETQKAAEKAAAAQKAAEQAAAAQKAAEQAAAALLADDDFGAGWDASGGDNEDEEHGV